jgi:hypothetical protein
MAKKRDHAEKIPALCRIHSIPEPAREHEFVPGRKFRFDAAWPAHRVAVEIHGGEWIGGGHSRGHVFSADQEKMRHAALLGWRVLPFTGEDLAKYQGMVVACIRAALSAENHPITNALNNTGDLTARERVGLAHEAFAEMARASADRRERLNKARKKRAKKKAAQFADGKKLE